MQNMYIYTHARVYDCKEPVSAKNIGLEQNIQVGKQPNKITWPKMWNVWTVVTHIGVVIFTVH